MINSNPYYPGFRNHWFINKIANNQRWTTSKDKMPINLNKLKTESKIEGCYAPQFPQLDTLDELNEISPALKKYTYYLDGFIDGFVVLDIEADCPEEIKNKLLTIPALYREVSMSGKGIHLIMHYPKIITKYKNAAEKTVLKHKKKWYEILIKHYITFTGHLLPEPKIKDYNLFDEIVEELAKEQNESIRTMDIETIKDLDKIKKSQCYDFIYELCYFRGNKWLNEHPAESFNNDLSRFEFTAIMNIYKSVRNIAHTSKVLREKEYTMEELAAITYILATDLLPPRKKHKEFRNKIPWLYYITETVAGNVELKHMEKQKKGNSND